MNSETKSISPADANTTDSLFRDRAPEAAARQLATVLASATECELATLEALRARKSASKYDVRRHEGIAKMLVSHCRDLGVRAFGPYGVFCPRLADALIEGTRQHATESTDAEVDAGNAGALD